MTACNFRSLLLAAIVLSNCISWTASRHHYTHNVHQHRTRHRRQGAGLYLPASYVIPGGEGGGGWGEWGEISPCSRTCGGGVASQKRICLQIGPDGQPQCEGGDTKYFSCQTHDCPEGAVDFRAEQCAEFNDKDFRGFKYDWVPYTKALRPCELNCMPHGERFYFRHKLKVIDGTRCSDDSFDVCVDGSCQPVGCDMMLGSNAREDKCRECRGNGTNCHTTSGIFDSQDLVKGYNDILLIPQGSTTIIIEEVEPSNNYLALRAKDGGTYYLNGHYHIDFPRSIMIAGALWTYERSQQGYAAPDKLRCLGPTSEPLILSLLLQDTNVGIRFEYSIPNNTAPPTDKQYNWVHKDFTPCSASCGGGFQTRNVTCRSREELEIVEDQLCDEGLKPPTDQSCNLDPCPAQWVEGPWGNCTKRCGSEGVRSREVTCQQIISNGIPSIVPDKKCVEQLGPKPALFQECNRDAPCPTWFVGHWKPCDRLCGKGKQKRQVVCYTNNTRIELFPDEDCTDEKPEIEKPCMKLPCDGVDWITTDWSGCDNCLSKVQTRSVVCSTAAGEVLDDSFCSYHTRPADQEACDKASLPHCEVQWYASQWSKCSVECGEGVKTRKVFCGIYNGSYVEKVKDEDCAGLTKYNDTKPCIVPNEECPAQWFVGPWNACSKECGGGYKDRKVMCLRGDEVSTKCNGSIVLDSSGSCNEHPCNKDETLPVNSTSVTIMDEECDYDTSYPEVGLDADPLTGTTLDDMLSDAPSTAYSEFESLLTETGSGMGSTIAAESKLEGSGMGSSDTTLHAVFDSTITKGTTVDDLLFSTDDDSTGETKSTDSSESATTPTSVTGKTESAESSSTAETGSISDSSGSTSSDTTNSTESSTPDGTGSTSPDGSSSTETIDVSGTTPSSTDSSGSTSSDTDNSTESSTSDSTGSTPTDGTGSTESSTIDNTGSTSTDGSSSTETKDVSGSTPSATGSTDLTSSDTDNSTESSTSDSTGSTPTDGTGSTESGSTSPDGSSSTEIKDISGSTPSATGSTGLTSSEETSSTESSTSDSTGSTPSDGTGSTDSSTTDKTGSIPTGSTDLTSSDTTNSTESSSTDETVSTSPDGSSSTETTDVSGSTPATGSTGATSSDKTSSTESSISDSTGSKPTDGTGSTESSTSDASGSTPAGSTSSTSSDKSSSTESSTSDSTGSTLTEGSDSTESSITDVTGSTPAGSTSLSSSDTTNSTESSTSDATGSTPIDGIGSTGSSTTDKTGSTSAGTSSTSSDTTNSTESSASDVTGSTPTDGTGSTESSTTDKTGSTSTDGSSSTEPTDITGSTLSGSTSSTSADKPSSTESSTTDKTGSTSTDGSSSIETSDKTASTLSGSTSSTSSDIPSSTESSSTDKTGSTSTDGSSSIETSDKTGSTLSGSTSSTSSDKPSSTESSTTDKTGSTSTDGSSSTERTDETGSTLSGSTSSTSSDKPSSTESSTTDKTGSTSTDGSSSTEPTDETGSTLSGSSSSTSSDKTSSSESSSTEKTSSTSSGSTDLTSSDNTSSTEPSTVDKTGSTPTEGTGSTTDSKATGSTGSLRSDNASSTESTTDKTASTPIDKESTSASTSVHTTESSGSTGSSVTETIGSSVSSETTEPSVVTTVITSTSSEFKSSTEFEPSSTSTSSGSKSTTTPELASTTTAASTLSNSGSDSTIESSTTPGSMETTELSSSSSTTLSPTTLSGSEYTTEATETRTTEASGSTTLGLTTTEASTIEGFTMSSGKTTWDLSTTMGHKIPGTCIRRRKLTCNETQFGCCPDNKTAAGGPFDGGCLKPRTCEESLYGCCPDGLSPALGDDYEGCPIEACADTLFGCCLSDNKTAAQGNDQDGCPPPPPACASSEFGCCDDNESEASGPEMEGCPELDFTTIPADTETTETTTSYSETDESSETSIKTSETTSKTSETTSKTSETTSKTSETTSETSEVSTTSEASTTIISSTTLELCASFKFGCCFDNETEASGPDGQGCPCNTTEFGCCPDDVSPAQGVELEGCPGHCSTSQYGCCKDNKTPAHGPDFEGCCLLESFKCCPDNRKPAEGPHLEGCGCQYTSYGCCPDNVTTAQGPDNKGCGCAYSEHGCCPDRHAEAAGPNYEGCSCNTFQFGCCDDGVSVAKGPDFQGCRCVDSKFGCCGDGVTAATGVNATGCDCSTSKYGCCPDGSTEATGPKFHGCTDAPENKQAVCILPTDAGPCHNFTAFWFYDLAYGGCSRFWYGGCEGNGNRFATKEDCEDVCVQPAPRDACKLPSVKGPCDGDSVRWYYNSSREQCMPFRYGGCLGNDNNFDTSDLCQAQCEPDKTTDQCHLPIERGPCAGLYSRWGFNTETHSCEQFTWGGCEGNGNRFKTRTACQMHCDPPGSPKPECKQQQDAGTCDGKEALWSFSSSENRCMPFYYSGCGGNDNRFESRETCEQTCPSVYVPDKCTLPAETGECSIYRHRWFYDTRIKRCRQFYYGGCGGNENNFMSESECERSCSEAAPPGTTTTTSAITTTTSAITSTTSAITTTTSTTPTPQQSQPRPDFCLLAIDPGPCKNMETKYAYDSSLGRCRTFEYGGCGGNRNNFPDETYCKSYCHPVEDPCSLPPDQGNCYSYTEQWYYDASRGQCIEFMYGGCSGNENRFGSQGECEARCKRPSPVFTTTTTSVAPPKKQEGGECITPSALAPCGESKTVFYYDSEKQQCLSSDFGNCGHPNTYNSEEECERKCGTFTGIDVCSKKLDPGPCLASIPKFYWDSISASCQPFAYGGCLGGPNRFSTVDECQYVCGSTGPTRECLQPVDLGESCARAPPVMRWHYSTDHVDCVVFAYQGCGGNDNNFRSYDQCVDVCGLRRSTIGGVGPPEVDCSILRQECQALICQYGIESVNENGCDRCKCVEDPCVRAHCSPSERCVTTAIQDPSTGEPRYSARCVTETTKRPDCARYEVECSRLECEFGVQRTSTPDGCERCACAPPIDNEYHNDCRPFEDECRRLDCKYGMDDSYSYQGCRRCKCKVDPCKGVSCAAGERCVVEEFRNSVDPETQYTSECRSIEKPGVCPPNQSSYDDKCSEQCQDDADCRGIGKCCRRGCSRMCLVPTEPATTHKPPPDVPGPPKALPPPEPQVSASVGGKATLRCLFHSNPPPKITWRRQLHDIIIDGTTGRYRLLSDGALEIVSLYRNDTGVYICIADNGLGVATQEIYLSVDETTDAPDCERYEAECLRLECEFSIQRTSTPEGCERCACAPPDNESDDCRPFEDDCRRLDCTYGMDITDFNGCRRCKCKVDPCKGVSCGTGERCVVEEFRNSVDPETQYTSECRSIEKPGVCPAGQSSYGDKCSEECQDDADCRGIGKCCRRGCSRMCLVPTEPATTHKPPPDMPAPPKALAPREPQVTATEGGKATLRCLFHGNPPPKITWRRRELTIDGSTGRYRLLSDGTLEIVSLYRNDTGVYICIADNGLGVATQEIYLTVDDPVRSPVGIAGDENAVVTGDLGKPLSVHCQAYGYPKPLVYWYRGGNIVPFNDAVFEARGTVLLIRSLAIETLGQYTCHAYNGVGTAASWVVSVQAYQPEGMFLKNEYVVPRSAPSRLAQKQPPTAKESTTTTTTTTTEASPWAFTVPVNTHLSTPYSMVNIGTDLLLTCEVDGFPEPEVYWTKDGARIQPSDRITISGSTIVSRLSVSPVSVTDSGLYTCHARNDYSSHSDTAQIKVQQQATVPPTCTDNPFFADCGLIVRSNFCRHPYYSKFCCKSCVEAGHLASQEAEQQADQPYRRK